MNNSYILVFANLETRERVARRDMSLPEIDKISVQCEGFEEFSAFCLRDSKSLINPNLAYILRQIGDNQYEKFEVCYSDCDMIAGLQTGLSDERVSDGNVVLLHLFDLCLKEWKSNDRFKNIISSYLDGDVSNLLNHYLTIPDDSASLLKLKVMDKLMNYRQARQLAIGVNHYSKNEVDYYNELINEQRQITFVHGSIASLLDNAIIGGENELDVIYEKLRGHMDSHLNKLLQLIDKRNSIVASLKMNP